MLVSDCPEPLCGHGGSHLVRRGYRARCAVCGSFWDLDNLGAAASPAYDGDYPALRSHHDPAVGDNKVATLEAWLDAAGLTVDGRVVCEVGFGGGFCLRALQQWGAQVAGIEAVDDNIAYARELGVDPVGLCAAAALPEELPSAVELWIFQDSFEHLEAPEAFLRWMVRSSAPKTQVLIVVPQAGSRSDRLLGRLWPHKLPDHRFHWSAAGLEDLFGRHGFGVKSRIDPKKRVSSKTVVGHVAHKLGVPLGPARRLAQNLPELRLTFNIGELGMVLERQHRP